MAILKQFKPTPGFADSTFSGLTAAAPGRTRYDPADAIHPN